MDEALKYIDIVMCVIGLIGLLVLIVFSFKDFNKKVKNKVMNPEITLAIVLSIILVGGYIAIRNS